LKGTVVPVLLTVKGLKKPAALRLVLRMNSYNVAWKRLVPLCDGDVDVSAGGSSILGALVVGYDLELGDGVGRNGDDLVVESLVALTVGHCVETVEQEVIEHAALAVDIIRTGAGERVDGAGGRRGRGLTRAGDQAEQVGVVAGDKRKRFTLVVGDDLAAFTGLGLKLEGDVRKLRRWFRLRPR